MEGQVNLLLYINLIISKYSHCKLRRGRRNIMFKCIVFLLLILGTLANERPIVKTKNGLIRGINRKTVNGREYHAFEGIPYAKPPVGELRFNPPVPKEPWAGIWDANTEYNCVQLIHSPDGTESVMGNEDCLYINVYSPQINDENAKLDVVVFIHGGCFMFGFGSIYQPNYLLDHNVIYVTFNYRVGPLGFLGTEDEASPGNYGLKDQSLALKWIQENIATFGGNPEAVTITGTSAGGASVHYHYMSPMSRNLFARGISFSGVATTNWALVKNPLQQSRKLGVVVGCGQVATKDLVDCLRQRSAKQLAAASKKLQPWLYNPYTPFGPVVEPKLEGAFISEQPYEIIRSGKVADVPWITSVTKEEGLYPAAEFIYADDRLPYLEKNWENLAPYILHYDATVDKNSWSEVAQKIRKHYLGDRPISTETFPELVQAIGDRLFVTDAVKAARLQASVNKSPVYFYKFSYRGDHSLSDFFSGSSENYGVSHADDLFYVIPINVPWFKKYMESENDKKLSKILINMWIAYTSKGKPKIKGIKWKSVSKKINDPLIYLEILGPDNFTLKEAEELGHESFWNSLPFKENEKFVVVKDEL